MGSDLLTILFRPDEYFREHAQEEAALGMPLGIVFVYALLSALGGYQMSSLMTPMFEGGMEGYGAVIGIFGAVGGFIAGIMFWILAAVVFYLVSMLFKGEGSLKKVAEAAGYGMAPFIASVGIGIAYLATVADQVTIPVIRDFMDPAAIDAAVEAFLAQPVMADVMLLQGVLSLVFMIWAANIWYYGIRYARNLTGRDAGIVVLVPVAIYLLVTIMSIGVL
ncbi:MAG: YIP1 family protein [Methanocalculus sp. MSAO_Arc1]|uniref:Yip1 family protein n=1 Tax=Methanocalculus TaxID=71151 RepID=UPI000FF47199|nr:MULTISPECIES: Yip1 family protein [unclassified Methanocalculus]MCP1661594.1 hypothetical protein [Methanocalculus sp. AMF5]RQD81325.1 MAG: YIP1 family protein [Methanocalculus sp. MSAO_Arc1]